MSTITQFQFDIFPESCPEQGFSLLYGYVFQGILMKWIKNMDPTLAENLHKMKDEDGNTLKRLYSIQYKRIMKRNPHYQQPRTISNKNKERGPHRKMGDNEVVEINNNGLDQVDESIRKGSSCKRAGQSNRADQGNKVGGPNRKPRDTSRINAHTKRGDQSRKLNPKYHRGVRFTVNSANNELSRALFKLHLNSNLNSIQIGKRPGVIADISISYQPLEKLLSQKKHSPLQEFSLKFYTPTSFSVSGREEVMCLPLSHYVFGNLTRQWNSVLLDSSNAIPPEFYSWVKKHVVILYHSIETKTWHRGKRRSFVGFIGWTKYKVLPNHGNFSDLDGKFREMLPILLKFGEFMNLGRGRTAGFGNFKVKSRLNQKAV